MMPQGRRGIRQRQFSRDGDPGRRLVTGSQGGDAGERGEWKDE
jgi:hypothetical protein